MSPPFDLARVKYGALAGAEPEAFAVEIRGQEIHLTHAADPRAGIIVSLDGRMTEARAEAALLAAIDDLALEQARIGLAVLAGRSVRREEVLSVFALLHDPGKPQPS